MNTTKDVANRFYELCSAGRYQDAMQELYADNARHVEAVSMPGCEQVVEGKQKLIEMSKQWHETTTIHEASCSKPLVNGDQFVCDMSIDVTSSAGPMAGQRHKMSETCLYTVAGGKIVEAKFFYAM